MQIFSIGIYQSDFNPEYFVNQPSRPGSEAAAEIERIIQEIRARPINPHIIHRCSRHQIDYYIKNTGNHIYVCAANGIDSMDEIHQLMQKIDDVVSTNQYDELGNMIENPDYQPSKIKQVSAAVSDVQNYLEDHVRDVLNERGKHIENLLEKTQSLCDNPVSFKSNAFQRRQANRGFFSALGDYLCFFSCCGRPSSRGPSNASANPAFRQGRSH